MEPALTSILLVTAHVLVLAVGALLYLRRVRMDRPPIGVFNRRDIVVITLVIIAIPPLYLRLPNLVIGGLFALVALVILQFTIAPLTRSRAGWLIALAAVAANVALAVRGGEERDPLFFAVNNVLIVVLALGVANLWTQAGLRAREVALFAVLLTIYDVVAVTWLPAMVEFFFRVAQLPFAPAVAWGDGSGMVGVGVGDLLVIALWVTVTEKAYGTRAALAAGASGVLAVVALLATFWLGWVTEPVPAMVLLGPMIVGEYLLLRRGGRRERTIAEYYRTPGEAAAPVSGQVSGPDTVAGALPLLPDGAGTGGPSQYVAMAGSEVLAEAPTAAEALQAARAREPGTVPALVWTPSQPARR